MDRELYINTIKNECAFLENEGYIFNQLENNIYLTKDSEYEGFRIRFSWLEYGENFTTYGLISEKRFNIIEQELQKILGAELVNYYTIHKSPSVDSIPEGLKFTNIEKNIRFVSNKVIDLELFGEFLRDFYFLEVIKFYSNYKDLFDVTKTYEKLERNNISSFIVNNGSDIFYRELVIKNKSKAIDENEFVQMVISELESRKQNPTFSKILENFQLLQNNLHSKV